jgi:uncharacterized protein YoxC
VTRTVVLAVSLLLGAALVAGALTRVATNVRALSTDLAALTHEVNLIGADVKSLADDLAALTDALTEEAAPGEDEPCPSDAQAPPAGGV